jgi:hypothetical protein
MLVDPARPRVKLRTPWSERGAAADVEKHGVKLHRRPPCKSAMENPWVPLIGVPLTVQASAGGRHGREGAGTVQLAPG